MIDIINDIKDDELKLIYNETLFSKLSDRIPNNIKNYIIKLVRYENSLYYKIRNNKTDINNYKIDLKYEEKHFYENMKEDIEKTYTSLFPQYSILFNNSQKIINYLEKKIN